MPTWEQGAVDRPAREGAAPPEEDPGFAPSVREGQTVEPDEVEAEQHQDAEVDDEYKWHTDRTARMESAESDAVEFIDVKKSFGRNAVLNGLNLGIPDGQISMILGPSGTGKSVCI